MEVVNKSFVIELYNSFGFIKEEYRIIIMNNHYILKV